jgi:hypothetical protein
MLKQVLAQLPSRPDGQPHYIILDGIDYCEDWPDSKDQLFGSLPKKDSVKILLFLRVVSNSWSSDLPVMDHLISIVLRTTPWAIPFGTSYIFFEATERRPVFFDGRWSRASYDGSWLVMERKVDDV